jgi:hypothetical protein
MATATVAIVHAGEDTLPARALAEKLRAIRLSPILEKPAGEEVRNAVKDAVVTIVLWSPNSVTQQQLVEDVAFAKGKSKVIHATMRNAEVPGSFRNDNTVNLTGWKGDDDFPAWLSLAKLVTKQAGVAAPPPPAPKPPSGFFQPGRVPEGGAAPPPRQGASRPQAPRPAPPPRQAQQSAPRSAPPPRATPVSPDEKSSGGRGLIIGAIAAVVLLGGGAGAFWFWNQSQTTTATATAWDNVERNDATAIRAFLDANPGEYRDEAETALAELEERSYEAASDADTIEALEGFVNDFPQSEHALSARGRIAELRAQPQAPTVEGAELPLIEPADPDLVPPGATAPTTPPAQSGGPATLTPPPEPTDPEPDSAPTN